MGEVEAAVKTVLDLWKADRSEPIRIIAKEAGYDYAFTEEIQKVVVWLVIFLATHPDLGPQYDRWLDVHARIMAI